MQSKSLNSLEIYETIIADTYAKQHFKGVVPRDKLPKCVFYPCSFVVNTENSNQSGEHWLAVYYDKKGECTFFDSFGQSPQFYGLDSFLIKTSKSVSYNSQQLQSVFSNTCGYYCIFFILLKSRDLSLHEILNLFSKSNFNINDFYIKNIYP